MAFFGLTALGPQSVFSATYKHAYTVILFDIGEFGEAFDEFSAPDGTMDVTQIELILRRLYRGPPPEFERARVMKHFEGETKISKETFLLGIKHLQDTAEVDATEEDRRRAAHYDSFQMLREQRDKGVRSAYGPSESFSAPLTLMQDMGWSVTDKAMEFERYPKKHCAETKFAASLHASGYL